MNRLKALGQASIAFMAILGGAAAFGVAVRVFLWTAGLGG